jgi:hypothetical protein
LFVVVRPTRCSGVSLKKLLSTASLAGSSSDNSRARTRFASSGSTLLELARELPYDVPTACVRRGLERPSERSLHDPGERTFGQQLATLRVGFRVLRVGFRVGASGSRIVPQSSRLTHVRALGCTTWHDGRCPFVSDGAGFVLVCALRAGFKSPPSHCSSDFTMFASSCARFGGGTWAEVTWGRAEFGDASMRSWPSRRCKSPPA